MVNSSLYDSLLGSISMKGGSKHVFNGKNLMKLMFLKKEFLILVFANLIAQLGITYYVMKNVNAEYISIWPLFIAQLIMVILLSLFSMPPAIKFLIFCVFSYTFGLTLSQLKHKYSEPMIEIAIQGAMSIFGLMMAAGVLLVGSGIQLGYKFGAFLFWALLALIVARLVFVLGQGLPMAHKILSYVGIFLFSLFVVYDTNQILRRDYYGDFITASLDYYLDILNLFSNILGTSDN
jgi:modulator of FtsH protease